MASTRAISLLLILLCGHVSVQGRRVGTKKQDMQLHENEAQLTENEASQHQANPGGMSPSFLELDGSLHIDKPLVFNVGDEVEYYSTRKGSRKPRWFKCEIAATSQGDDVTNSYSLKWPADDKARRAGKTFKTNVLPGSVRFPKDALVLVRGSSQLLTGVVMSYDVSTEIYTLKFPECQNQQKPISRGDVLARLGSFNTDAQVMYYDAERDPTRGSRERKAFVTAHDQNAETYTIMLLSIDQGEASQRDGISRTLLWKAGATRPESSQRSGLELSSSRVDLSKQIMCAVRT